MTAGNIFTLTSCKRTVINGEYHGQSRFINTDTLQFLRVFSISNGITDIGISKTDQGYDITGANFLSLNTFQPFISIKTADFRFTLSFFIHQSDRLTVMDSTANHASDNDTSYIIVIIQCIDQHLQRSLYFNVRCGNIFQNDFKERF